MEEKPTIVEAGEKINIMGTCDVNSRELPTWEMDVPGRVVDHLEIYVGDRINFIEEKGRIYIEKAQDCLKTMTDEKTIVLDKEKKTASKQDYYTDYEKSMKEKFEPGSVSIKGIDREWNMQLPDNIHYALGLTNGDHVRFEAVDRETFEISKIR